ncbi:flavin reductase family protein [Amycolatopsis rubida]|uniref:Flavin reductase family protein n=1 Tax=Amycolatopsis rubida TaxID=112413 RepID=A0ABX0BXC6_9PSEU|nr:MULTISPECIES: flavin reductase family protein [Amycolatopsis]MYW92960.1 hypothetical protein [Amycolatopsis rubida]NEC57947.1 flavin reductase family protein [Amycolatopsis rubida]OAP25484.1 p-hydroxyphenylacetate 3-hydroxylase, reductase component [Amycolatopsis sp. M39]
MDLATGPFGGTQVRTFFGQVPAGVLALAADSHGESAVMTICSFTTVSIEPPLLVASIRRESATWPLLKRAPRLGGSILSHCQAGLARRLSTGEARSRIAGTPVTRLDSGALLFEGASAWFEAELTDEFPAGDHCLAVLRISAIGQQSQASPLVFHRSTFATVSGA